MWPWIEDPDDDDVLLEKARALAAAPRGPGAETGDDPIDPRTAPLVAQRLCAEEISLAPGCNSAAYVGWLGTDMGRTTTVTQARRTLQANAFRDWLWFGTHHAPTGARLESFALVVGHRANPRHPVPLLEIVEAVRRGETTDEHRRAARRVFPDPDLAGRPGPAPTPERWEARLAEGRRTGRVSADGRIAWGSRGL